MDITISLTNPDAAHEALCTSAHESVAPIGKRLLGEAFIPADDENHDCQIEQVIKSFLGNLRQQFISESAEIAKQQALANDGGLF